MHGFKKVSAHVVPFVEVQVVILDGRHALLGDQMGV